VADEARDLVVLVRPGRRQHLAEERVQQEAGGDDRHHPARGAPHRFQDQQSEPDAEHDVPGVRQDRAVEEIVAARDQIDGGADGGRGQQPVPPHDAVLVAPRHGEDEEAQEQHDRDVDRAQVLGAHDGVGGVEVKQRRADRHRGDEDGEPAREAVLHPLLALDHLLGARQRLGADFLGRLVQPRDVFAHLPLLRLKAPQTKSPASDGGALRGAGFS
jgi:hypothetical protein